MTRPQNVVLLNIFGGQNHPRVHVFHGNNLVDRGSFSPYGGKSPQVPCILRVGTCTCRSMISYYEIMCRFPDENSGNVYHIGKLSIKLIIKILNKIVIIINTVYVLNINVVMKLYKIQMLLLTYVRYIMYNVFFNFNFKIAF